MKKTNLFFIAISFFLCSCGTVAGNVKSQGTEGIRVVSLSDSASSENLVPAYKKKTDKTKKKGDFYNSVLELRANHTEGTDFRTVYELRKSSVAVFAIHGGKTEWGTSSIAKAIAGTDYSYYRFEALVKNNWKFHVTATNFDDPPALRVAEESMFGISVHVQKGDEDIICVGGGNKDAAKMMADMLVSAGYPVEYPCKKFPGESPKNIVNRTKLGGVQFEFTFPLIQKIVKNKKKLKNFSKKVRDTAEKYLNSLPEPIQQQMNE